MSEARSPALDLVTPILRCPTCGEPLARAGSGLRCAARHSFDVARQGYASLLAGSRPISGDDGPMVEARRRFLEGGAYAPILARLVDLAAPAEESAGVVLDAGCGPGYYLAGVLDAWPSALGLGLDSSVYALRRAARAHPRAAAVACDLFGPFPVASTSVDLVLNVFSPHNPAEFHRILRPHGRLLLTRPTDGHLTQLRRHLPAMVAVDPAKERRLEETMDPHFMEVRTVRTECSAPLTPREAIDLVSMTPSARHMDIDDLGSDSADALPREVGISVLTTEYRPR